MPRYEFSEGGSNKFWEITLKNSDVLTHYGRIGAAGQSTTKSFKTPEEAKAAYEKLIAEKTKKGYVAHDANTQEAAAGAAAPASDASANPLIARLDRWMKANRPTYYASFKPGSSADELANFEKKLGAKLPQTLKDLLMWRNSDADDPSPERFIGNWSLMSLREIVSTWEGLNGLKEGGDFDDLDKDWWNKSWVPFLENGGGDNLCIDVRGAVAEKGEVIRFWHDDEGRKILYKSIDALLESFLPWLEKGKWDVDDDGIFYFGTEFTPSPEARKGRTRPEPKPIPPKPKREPRPADPKIKEECLIVLPKMNYGWKFYAHVSPDGKHTVYKLQDKKSASFVLDGKPSATFEGLLGPWFDRQTGILVYRETTSRKSRWYIGDQIHDYFERSDNPAFSPDGKHVCYGAKKGKKWKLAVDGKLQGDGYDFLQYPVWSPDGTKIAFAAEEDGKRFVVVNGDRGPECLEPRGLVFSPDGSKLAYLITAKQPILQYHVVCGDFKSELLDLPVDPGFTSAGELWYTCATTKPRNSYGIQIGGTRTYTPESIHQAFFLEDGKLAGYLEYGGESKARLIRPGKPTVDVWNFDDVIFRAPDTYAFITKRMMPDRTEQVKLCINGRESDEYDDIRHPAFSPDGKTIMFSALRDLELWWVEMAVE